MAIKKKGFFFSTDAFLAILIFTLVLVSIYGYFIGTQELRQQYYFSEDLFDIFINTNIEEIEETESYETFLENMEIDYPEHIGLIDKKLTIMEQLITINNNVTQDDPAGDTIARELTSALISTFFEDSRYGFNFNVNEWAYLEDEGNPNAIVARQRFV